MTARVVFTLLFLYFARAAIAVPDARADALATPYVLIEGSGDIPIASSSSALVSGKWCSPQASDDSTVQFLAADVVSGNVTVLNADWTPFAVQVYPALLHNVAVCGGDARYLYPRAITAMATAAGSPFIAIKCSTGSSVVVELRWPGATCATTPTLKTISGSSLIPSSPSDAAVDALSAIGGGDGADVLLAVVSSASAGKAFAVALDTATGEPYETADVAPYAPPANGTWRVLAAPSADRIAAVWAPHNATEGAQYVGIGLSLATDNLAVVSGPTGIPPMPQSLVGGVVMAGVPGVADPSVHALALVDEGGHVWPLAFGCGAACLAQPAMFTPLAALPIAVAQTGRSGIGPGLEPGSAATFVSPGVGPAFARRWAAVTAARGGARLAVWRGAPAAPPAVAGATDQFPVSLVVYGAASEMAQRRAALANVRGQMRTKATFNASAGNVRNLTSPVNTTLLIDIMRETNANVLDFIVCDCVLTPGAIDCSALESYVNFVSLLEATKPPDTTSGTTQPPPELRVWLELMPPSEAAHGDACLTPPDDPRTPFNDTAFFDPALGYMDYAGWATLAGKLATRYNQLTAINIDDMSHDIGVGNPFPPNLIARMTSQLRGQGAPWMALASAIYYAENGVWSYGRWPDLPMVIDATVSFFRPSRFCRTLFQIERAALHSLEATARILILAHSCSAMSWQATSSKGSGRA